ncbi:hypothetical protein A2415_03520 [candidate division WWE3 bacterium RIFOXYC1_FULL_39_7]|uniref:YokE-like PH domain-containing protein n=2 Tax=Katanobacteria TaxID=422282 RepID=A0A1F4X9J7_UNCKA|nr:MAG: hypothetical protein A2415_03520 [candidate division WWE3 bacterium RIFOXYC1_FULL_39_7]OGC78375.1 MAG: hypothetical protein A2619_05110 [candidate division WWE3 bacterium RIFOXYD1_FULL_39_9]
MSKLLLKLQGLRSLNRTIFPPYLFVYDDILIYKKRKWIWVKEISISYGQISQVTLNKGIFFSSLDIYSAGTDNIVLRFIPTEPAVKAKKILDQKVYHSHAKHQQVETGSKVTLSDYEKSLNRLQELLNKNKISQRDFHRKKSELIKDL